MSDERFSKFNNDYMKITSLKGKHDRQDAWLDFGSTDRVNSPAHYTQGSQEAIVTIEEAIDGAPSIQAGMLQAQILKYLLRVWYKDNPLEDLKKARWYLDRLISKLQ